MQYDPYNKVGNWCGAHGASKNVEWSGGVLASMNESSLLLLSFDFAANLLSHIISSRIIIEMSQFSLFTLHIQLLIAATL